MKKIVRISILMALMLLLVFPCSVVIANADKMLFAGGSGTAEDPYLISDQYQLNNIRVYPDAHYVLTNDIVFEDKDFQTGGKYFEVSYSETDGTKYTGWYPIQEFKGTLDGKGFAIRNNIIADCGWSSFIDSNYGNIVNVGFADTSGHSLVNISLICCANYGTINNCYCIGSFGAYGRDDNCFGVCDTNYGVISNLVSSVNMIGNTNFGICNSNQGDIVNCINYGQVVGSKKACGMVYNNKGTIQNAVSFGSTLNMTFDGELGFVYVNDGKISTSFYYVNNATAPTQKYTDSTEIKSFNVFNHLKCDFSALLENDSWELDLETNTPYLKNNPFYSRVAINFDDLYDVTDNLSVQPHSYKSIKLSWDQVDGAIGYILYRSPAYMTDGEKNNILAIIDNGNVSEYIDTNIEPNTQNYYSYKVCPVFSYDGVKVLGTISVTKFCGVVDTMLVDYREDIPPDVIKLEILTTEAYRPGILAVDMHVEAELDIKQISLELMDRNGGIIGTVRRYFSGKKSIDGVIEFPLPIGGEYGEVQISSVSVFTEKQGGSIDGRYYDDSWIEIKEEFDVEFTGVLSNAYLKSQIDIMEEGKTAIVIVDEVSNGILKKDILDTIRGKDKTLVVYSREDGSVQWVINGKEIIRDTKDLNVKVELKKISAEKYGAKKDVLALEFADNGVLPADVDFRVKAEYINTMYSNNRMYLYYEQGEKLSMEDDDCVVIKEDKAGWCYVDITHNSTFYLSGEKLCTHQRTNGVCSVCDAGVTRLAGANRLETSYLVADELKAQLGIAKFDAIIVASGGTFADALPGSYLAAVKNAPILLTLAKQKYIDQTANYIKANLAEGGTVYILGGESAVPSSMETALTGIDVKRVAGADRFGTNLAILKEAGVKRGSEILVCTAKEFADSLSAAATGKPILLVYKKITDEQKAYLGTLSGNAFCVVGGSTAVPDNIIAEICNYGSVSRLAGKDRLDTSILVAQKYFPNATSSVVAYGWDFPDGLCGGSLAYATKSPLILTHSKEKLFKFTADYTVAAGLNAGYVLGGDGLVSDAAAKAIFNCNEITILK